MRVAEQDPFNPDDFRVLECRIIARILFLPERRSVVQPPRSNNIATHLHATCTAHVTATRARPDNLNTELQHHRNAGYVLLSFLALKQKMHPFAVWALALWLRHPGPGHLHGWYPYCQLQWIHVQCFGRRGSSGIRIVVRQR